MDVLKTLPNMEQLLHEMRWAEASDLHLKIGLPPVFRIAGRLKRPLNLPTLTSEDTERLLRQVMPPEAQEAIANGAADLDFSTFLVPPEDEAGAKKKSPPLRERFRCNVFKSGGGWHAAIRRVQPQIPTFDRLHLPGVYKQVAEDTNEGLVLVVGVTGSGKSTTLACMLEHLNGSEALNIVTIEDPIEFQINPRKSVVSQREIGVDVPDFPTALKHVVRQDPDVILIGELRDRVTVQAAIQAAETGHIVYGSMHSPDTTQSLSRILEFFPTDEHAFIRGALSASIKAVLAQRLLPALPETGSDLMPATEVVLTNPSVRELIRDGEYAKIPSVIASSANAGMHTFTQSLANLVQNEAVAMKVALEFAPNRDALSSLIKGVEVRSSTLTGS